MPKREPTPPPGEDEPYYFTILNPYPPNANMELQGDMLRMSQWLASAMDDTDALLALFHKPSSPRLLIIEVSRHYPHIRRLLGQHFWAGPKGILKGPAPAENYSAIFFCHYTTGRQVEKHGWKRKWIDGDMFATPKTRNKIFKNPYPATTYMAVPTIDPTALEYCRHLPMEEFPEVEQSKAKAKVVEPPVGSGAWAVRRDQFPSNNNQKKPIKTESIISASSSVSDLAIGEPTADAEESEPQNLWAATDINPLMTDFALASLSGDQIQDKLVCPFHGTTCKKMCQWRTDKERELGPKVGGPSNIKNYSKGRGAKSQRARPTVIPINSINSTDPSSPETGNMSPLSASSTTASGRGSVKSPTRGRAPPPPPRSTAAIVSTIKETTPEPSSLDAPIVPGIDRGAPNGPVRGAPVWASRGRGRGRA